MFAKLKKEIRLAATIAAGVFGGLLAYRLFMWTHEWWENLSTDNQQATLVMALALVLVGALVFRFRATIKSFCFRRRYVLTVALTALAVVAYIGGTAYARQQQAKQYWEQQVTARMMADSANDPNRRKIEITNPILARELAEAELQKEQKK